MRASRQFSSSRFLLLFFAAFCCCAVPGRAAEPLHQRIDATLQASVVGPVADPVDDAAFLRRIYLDLTGRIPSADEARTFLSDNDPLRRTQLIDQLLASPDFDRHLATMLDVMLMERRGGAHVSTDSFRAWLQQSIAANKPFHQLAGELIAADGTPDRRAASAFLLERNVEPNLVTREISRMFFGRDVQCAQCHDHPSVDDYKQEDYYGIYAFVSRSTLHRPDAKKPAVISEAADGQSPFKSVFTNREAFTAPRLPGEAEIVEPEFPAGEEYITAPSKTVAGVPRYSRRAKLAELVATGQNVYFRRNIANRLWAMVMGRGLVHPVDMHHSMNPPSHPELLALLSDEIAALNFNVKAFVRELVLTDVYQRSHRFSQPPTVDTTKLAATIQELEQQEAVADALSSDQDERAAAALEALDAVITEAEPLRASRAKARAAAVAAAAKAAEAAAAESGKRKAVDQKQVIEETLAQAVAKTRAAATLLGQPQELTTISTALQTRHSKASAELNTLNAQLDAAAKAATAAQAVQSKALAVDTAEKAKLAPLQETMRHHREQMVTAFRESQQAYEQVTHAEQTVEYLQQLKQSVESRAAVPAIRSAADTTEQQHQAMIQRQTQSQQILTKMTQEMTTLATAQQQAEQQSAELSRRMQTTQQAATILSEAVAKVRSATAVLPQDSVESTLLANLDESMARVQGMTGETQTQLDATLANVQQTTSQIAALKATAAAATQEAAAAKQRAVELQQQLEQLRQQLVTARTQQSAAAAAVEQHAVRQFHLATVEALTPEQLAWSVLQASGQIQRHVAGELAKLNKEKPLDEKQKSDAAIAERQTQAEAAAMTVLTKTVATFAKLFAAQSGQPQDDFFATVDQALFFANGSQVRGWLAPAGDNLTARLIRITETQALAEELYLSTLVRMPTADEVNAVAEYLQARGDQKSAAVQELAWALVTSAEFRFQY